MKHHEPSLIEKKNAQQNHTFILCIILYNIMHSWIFKLSKTLKRKPLNIKTKSGDI